MHHRQLSTLANCIKPNIFSKIHTYIATDIQMFVNLSMTRIRLSCSINKIVYLLQELCNTLHNKTSHTKATDHLDLMSNCSQNAANISSPIQQKSCLLSRDDVMNYINNFSHKYYRSFRPYVELSTKRGNDFKFNPTKNLVCSTEMM